MEIELVPPFRINADLDMGYMRNGAPNDHGEVLDLSNSGVLVQYTEMEKVSGRDRMG